MTPKAAELRMVYLKPEKIPGVIGWPWGSTPISSMVGLASEAIAGELIRASLADQVDLSKPALGSPVIIFMKDQYGSGRSHPVLTLKPHPFPHL